MKRPARIQMLHFVQLGSKNKLRVKKVKEECPTVHSEGHSSFLLMSLRAAVFAL